MVKCYMTKTVQFARKVGGSLMLRIPKEIVELENIQEGAPVEMEIRKAPLDWFGAFPRLKPFTKEDRARSHYE